MPLMFQNDKLLMTPLPGGGWGVALSDKCCCCECCPSGTRAKLVVTFEYTFTMFEFQSGTGSCASLVATAGSANPRNVNTVEYACKGDSVASNSELQHTEQWGECDGVSSMKIERQIIANSIYGTAGTERVVFTIDSMRKGKATITFRPRLRGLFHDPNADPGAPCSDSAFKQVHAATSFKYKIGNEAWVENVATGFDSSTFSYPANVDPFTTTVQVNTCTPGASGG